MPERKAIKGDAALVTALYDWMDEIERDHGCPVRVVLHKSKLKGRLDIRVEGCEASDGRLIGVRAQEKASFPNGDATTLVGSLLGLLRRLEANLTEFATFMEAAAGTTGVPQAQQPNPPSQSQDEPN